MTLKILGLDPLMFALWKPNIDSFDMLENSNLTCEDECAYIHISKTCQEHKY